jgi:hypothetical protein
MELTLDGRALIRSNRCVVAGRLANLDHNLQVLLIEGGENNLNNPWYGTLPTCRSLC